LIEIVRLIGLGVVKTFGPRLFFKNS